MVNASAKEPSLMTKVEVASELRCSVRKIDYMIDENTIPAPIKVGKHVRWRREDIFEWIRCGCPLPPTRDLSTVEV